MGVVPSAYLCFSRAQWERYRYDLPLELTEKDLERLCGVNEIVSLNEIRDIFLPLSRLLNMYVTETQSLHRITSHFLSASDKKVPYILGISGSVAVGKSTVSRVLQALLSRWDDHPQVALISTDGFLYSNEELAARGLMDRKGFPESYQLEKLFNFLAQVKSGVSCVEMPVYAHELYDIVPGETVVVHAPDILIVEGLNILQTSVPNAVHQPGLFVSDFLDFTIFVDAEVSSIRQWYIDRVLYFAQTSFKAPHNYFYFLSQMSLESQIQFATQVWQDINEVNLLTNILPFRERAKLILRKADNHTIDHILLRKL